MMNGKKILVQYLMAYYGKNYWNKSPKERLKEIKRCLNEENVKKTEGGIGWAKETEA